MEKDKNPRNELSDAKAHPKNTKSITKGSSADNGKDVPPRMSKKSDILEGGNPKFDQTQGNLSTKLIKIHSVKIVSVYRPDGYVGGSTDQRLRDRRYIYPNCGNNLEVNDTQINPWGAVHRNSIISIKKIGSRKIRDNASEEYKINNWQRLEGCEATNIQGDIFDESQDKSCSDGGFVSKTGVENRCAFCNLAKYKIQPIEFAYDETKHMKIPYNSPSIEEMEELRVDTSDPTVIIKYHETGDVEAQK